LARVVENKGGKGNVPDRDKAIGRETSNAERALPPVTRTRSKRSRSGAGWKTAEANARGSRFSGDAAKRIRDPKDESFPDARQTSDSRHWKKRDPGLLRNAL
jgi:hypothetical protein